MEGIQDAAINIENGLFARYALTKDLSLYIVRMIPESDESSSGILLGPGDIVLTAAAGNPKKVLAVIGRFKSSEGIQWLGVSNKFVIISSSRSTGAS